MEQDSYAKVNIFLKILGKDGGYHTLSSRFMRVKNFSDSIIWERKSQKGFETIFESPLFADGDMESLCKDNTILKAKKVLEPFLEQEQQDVLDFTCIRVIKRVPMAAGLGGGSADAATFLRMAQQQLEISLRKEQWNHIAKSVGADVAFFLDDVESANVSGIGEQICPFNEEALSLEIITPPVLCHTAEIYKHYSQHFFHHHSQHQELVNVLERTKSVSIMRDYSPQTLNDLSLSVCALYPELKSYLNDGWFLSGSGSSFFRLQ